MQTFGLIKSHKQSYTHTHTPAHTHAHTHTHCERKAKGQLLGQKASQVNKTQTICLTAFLTMCAYITTLCLCACLRVCHCVCVCVRAAGPQSVCRSESESVSVSVSASPSLSWSLLLYQAIWQSPVTTLLQHTHTLTHTDVNSMCMCACLELRLLFESHSAFSGFFIGPIEAVYRRTCWLTMMTISVWCQKRFTTLTTIRCVIGNKEV